jgi:ornithine cyclodeaminase/alanine dehydrogenase
MITDSTLLLTRDELKSLLTTADYLATVEEAFLAHAQGRTLKPALMHVDAKSGEFHIKAGGIFLERNFFALKSNGGFFGNAAHFGMPPIQGVILLCDADNGYPLAIMDSTAITIGRTAATTALAARHLAVTDASVVTICGCGTQGAEQLRYVCEVRPVEEVFAWDATFERAVEFAARLSTELDIDVRAVKDPGPAIRDSDICITCTPSRVPFVHAEYLHPGLFIAAVGADSPEKQELDADVLKASTVVVDLLEQCAHVGELHHALDEGMSVSSVRAELSEIVAGQKRGRQSNDEIIVFDATGTAIQDAAAAAKAFTRASATGVGTTFDFFSRVETWT